MGMLRSVVLDLKADLMPYLLPILLNFSDMHGAFGIIVVPVVFSCAVCSAVWLAAISQKMLGTSQSTLFIFQVVKQLLFRQLETPS